MSPASTERTRVKNQDGPAQQPADYYTRKTLSGARQVAQKKLRIADECNDHLAKKSVRPVKAQRPVGAGGQWGVWVILGSLLGPVCVEAHGTVESTRGQLWVERAEGDVDDGVRVAQALDEPTRARVVQVGRAVLGARGHVPEARRERCADWVYPVDVRAEPAHARGGSQIPQLDRAVEGGTQEEIMPGRGCVARRGTFVEPKELYWALMCIVELEYPLACAQIDDFNGAVAARDECEGR